VTHVGVQSAIDRGLAFLAQRQLPSGQFATYMGEDLTAGDMVFDSSPFTTALVVNSIGTSGAREMIGRALDFLVAEMEPPAVWRYWTADHPGHLSIPPDVDDTACISQALRRNGVAFPDNRSLLLANRDRRGRFYTWFTPRLGPRDLGFWRVALQRMRTPVRARAFWRDNSLTPRDVSCVVNANVLFYLGDGGAARPVTEYLVDLVRRGREGCCDQWYDNAFPFYYSVSRCIHAGIDGLDEIRDEMVERIVTAANPDGSIGETALDTAFAACALRFLAGPADAFERARGYLVASQSPEGGWPIAPLYHGGPPMKLRWGSEELTTGFCLEALLPLGDQRAPRRLPQRAGDMARHVRERAVEERHVGDENERV
jgi:hypothetical protein